MPDVKFITIYGVNSEDLNGRKTGIQSYHSTKVGALEHGKRRGAWGGNADVSPTPAISIDGIVYALVSDTSIDVDLKNANSDAELKEKTLASLTEDQKRVLGLSK